MENTLELIVYSDIRICIKEDLHLPVANSINIRNIHFEYVLNNGSNKDIGSKADSTYRCYIRAIAVSSLAM